MRPSRPLLSLFAANGVSAMGNVMAVLAIPWFVLQTTGSVVLTGVSAFASTLPHVLSGALGGAFVDKFGWRRTSVVSDVASAVTVALIPALHYTIGLEFWMLLVLVFMGGVLDAPGEAARSAMVPDLASTAGWRMERATSTHDGVQRAGRMLGGPVAGVLIALLGPAMILVVDAATFVVSAVLVRWAVPDLTAPSDGDALASYFARVRSGFRVLTRDPLLRAIVVMVMVTNMLDGATAMVLLPTYADRVLDSSVALGVIFGSFGVGAVLGTIAFGVVGHRFSRRATYTVAFLIAGAPRYAILAATPPLAVILVVMFIAGFAAGSLNPILSAVEYDRIPPSQRARVLAASYAGGLAAIPVGVLLAGYVVEAVGLIPTLLGVAAIYFLATLSPLRGGPWREMDAPTAARSASSATPAAAASPSPSP